MTQGGVRPAWVWPIVGTQDSPYWRLRLDHSGTALPHVTQESSPHWRTKYAGAEAVSPLMHLKRMRVTQAYQGCERQRGEHEHPQNLD